MQKWVSRIIKSKTMLFSIGLALCGVVEASTGFLQSVMSPNSFGWLMLGIGAVSAVLRIATKQPLSDK